MANQQVSNPPSAAYYLTLIGGILGIIVGAILTIFLIGIWIVIANVLMIVYAQRLMQQPSEHSKYGTYILILSILSGLNLLCAYRWNTRSNISTNANRGSNTTLPNNRTLYTANRYAMHPPSIAHNAVTQSAEKPNFAQNAAKNSPHNHF